MAISWKDNELLKNRTAGVLLPLFSMRSSTDWGCGDMASFKEWISYLGGEGVKSIQILPIHETAPTENFPYSALSAYAIDPVYISIKDVPEVKNSPKAQEFIKMIEEEIAYWRGESKVQFKYVKDAKFKVLWLAYEHFIKEESEKSSQRFNEFLDYQKKNAHWLVSYSIFRAVKDKTGWSSWKHWESKFKDIDIAFLKEFMAENNTQMMFFTYMQWIVQTQLAEVRALAKEKGVYILGDIPFGVNFDSADVWANQNKYKLNSEVGAPGDDMAEDGQKWGLPAYDWEAVAANNFNLWRGKITRACEIYDAFRIDHLVGFFRTWVYDSPEDKGHYDITDEAKQLERGSKFMEAVKESCGDKLAIGEDLGMIPDYLRQYMKETDLPGYKVLRWEKDNEVYRDPKDYAVASLATTSTHDTSMMKEWWETMPSWQRANAWEMLSGEKTDGSDAVFTPHIRKTILKHVMQGASSIVIFPIQDIIGTSERINIPGTIREDNWTYRVSYETAEFHSKYLNEMREFKELIKETNR